MSDVQPTSNPVPSDHPADARDNFKRIDEIVNLEAPQTSPTRTGKILNTIYGLESAYVQTPINGGIWASGIDFTAYNQYMIFNGVAYKPKVTTPLPYTSTSAPDTNFVTPFSELTSANITDYTDLTFDSVVDMQGGKPGLSFIQGMDLKVNGENDKFTNYKVVNFSSDINLGGGLWAKKLDVDSSSLDGAIADNSRQDQEIGAVQTQVTAATQKNEEQDGRLSSAESDIAALQTGQGSGVVGYATQAELFADLDHPESTVGLVTNDSTSTNNTNYLKVGISGEGSWSQGSETLASQAFSQSQSNLASINTLDDGFELDRVRGYLNVDDYRFNQIYKQQSAPIAPVIILLGQSLNAARLTIAQEFGPSNVKMLSTGCHISSFPFWSSNQTWCMDFTDTETTSPLSEGGDGQSPCVGVANSILGGSIKTAYVISLAIGSRDISVISSSTVRSNVHAACERLCAQAVSDGFVPKVIFYSAHGEADASINNSGYEEQSTLFYKDMQLTAAQAMQDPTYRAPVILTYPMQSSASNGYDKVIADDISNIAKAIPNGIDAGALYQWSMEADRVHPTPQAYVERGEFIGRIIREYLSNNFKRDALEITDASWSGSEVRVIFSENIVRDASNTAGTNLNVGVALDGFEVADSTGLVSIISITYAGPVATITMSSNLSGTVQVRIANQDTTASLVSGIENNVGSQIRTEYLGFNSIFSPSDVNQIWAKRQTITARAL